MVPLPADYRISENSVLAVQEPWRNPRVLTTHNPSNSSFHLFYPPSAEASVCFFVNKSLNPSSYSAGFLTPKYSYLRIRGSVEGVRDVTIHDVYRTQNLPLTSSENQPPDEPLPLDTHEIFSFVSAAISDASADHVLLGDFNIHHPNWGGPRVTPHRASQLLLSLQVLHNLSLLLPPESITFKRHGGESMIDLVFSSSDLMNSLTACCLRDDLDHGSDHYPIETSFLFAPHVSPHAPKPLWRKADKAALSQRARELDLLPRNNEKCGDIDAGVDRLVRWIKEAVAQHIPLSKPVSFFVPWWSSELTQLVRSARRARRWHKRRPCVEAWRDYLEALNTKGEAIRKAKAV
jgi:hypothetical protein